MPDDISAPAPDAASSPGTEVATVAFGPGPGRRRRRALAGLLVVLALAAGLVALNWRSLNRYAAWGSPIVEEHFDNDAWKARWGARGRWEQRDGRVTSAGIWDNALIFKRRLTPPVAIEYTASFPDREHAGDLSVWWCEDNPFKLRPNQDIDDAKAWYVQAGSSANSWCTIWQTPARTRSQVNSLVLQPGRSYRFRVEIASDRLAMWIDGDLVLEHREIFPIGSGHLALYTWDPGKSFDEVRIFSRPVPELVSPLVVGDEALRAGRFDDAMEAYGHVADSHRGRKLGDEAVWLRGLTLHRQGKPALAREEWKTLPDGPLRQRADCLHLDDLVAQGEIANAADHFTRLWRAHPEVHGLLRQRWLVCGQRLHQQRNHPAMESWLVLREATFPEDHASRLLAAEMLSILGRWEEIIRRFPDERRAVAWALLKLGRNQEVLQADWTMPIERQRAMLNQGDLEGALRLPGIDPGTQTAILCKLGRPEEAAKIGPYPAQVYLGGLDAVLAEDGFGQLANEALIGAGRLAEAAGKGVAGSPRSGGNRIAQRLLGRLAELESRGWKLPLERMLEHLAAGRIDQARELRPTIELGASALDASPWFARFAGLPLVDLALGDAAALRRGLELGARQTDGWGGRVALVCAAALDPAREPALAAMPWRTEVEAWQCLARALRGELAGDRAAALAAWRSFAALKPQQRLLEGHLPSVEAEAIAAWRLAELAR